MNAISGLLSTPPELLLALDKPIYTSEEPKIEQKQLIKGPGSDYYVSLKGKIVIRVKHGKSLQHNGIDVSFVNAIENEFDKSCNMILNSAGFSLDATNPMDQNNMPIVGGSVIPFEFYLPITYESYVGKKVKLIYFVECSIKRTLNTITTKELVPVFPEVFLRPLPPSRPIHLEVGIEDVLHLELSCKKNSFHLDDCIVGLLSFILVRIKIKTIELQILKKEAVGSFSTSNASDQSIASSYQVVDGPISKGDVVPIRCFLSALQLSPTFKEIEKRISIRYYLNLVLVDEENRRYFKQQEIDLFRQISGARGLSVEPSPSPLLLTSHAIDKSPLSDAKAPILLSESSAKDSSSSSSIQEPTIEDPKMTTVIPPPTLIDAPPKSMDPLYQSSDVWK